MTIRLIAKYTAMAIVACAIFLLMPSGKLFVFTVFMLIIIISINITRDYIHWTLMTFIFEKHKFKAKEKEDSVLQSLSASSKQGARIVEVYKKEREKDEKWLHDL